MYELKFEEQGLWEGWLLVKVGNAGHTEINMNFYPEELAEIQEHGLDSEKGREIAHEVFDDVMGECSD